MSIQKILWLAFPPYEYKVTVEQILKFTNKPIGIYGINIIAREKAINLAKNYSKTVYSIRATHLKPDQLALLLLFNVLTREIESGWNHIYRGILSDAGREMLSMWHMICIEQIRLGYSTQADYENDLEGLIKQIKEMG